MKLISYAQNFEDVMLWRALKNVEKGFYVDVGAHDPESGSVTKLFYDRGWKGINIEPCEIPFKSLISARINDINLQMCAGDTEGQITLYDVMPSGLATIKKEQADEYKKNGHIVNEYIVPIVKLNSILKSYGIKELHFLKIDVEGAERQVLNGINFKNFRPWIVVIEATHPNSQIESHHEWEDILLESGYTYAYFDGLNRFYVSDEHSDLIENFVVPINYFDNFALAKSSFFCREVVRENDLELKNLKNELIENKKRLVSVFELLDDRDAILKNVMAERSLIEAEIVVLRSQLNRIYATKIWRYSRVIFQWETNLHGKLKNITRCILRGLLQLFFKFFYKMFPENTNINNFVKRIAFKFMIVRRLYYFSNRRANQLVVAPVVIGDRTKKIYHDLID